MQTPKILSSNTTMKVSLPRRHSAMDFVQVIKEMGIPLTYGIHELLALDTRDVIDNSVVNTVRTVEDIARSRIAGPANRSLLILHNPSIIASLSRRTPCLSSACLDFQHQRQRQAAGTGLPVER